MTVKAKQGLWTPWAQVLCYECFGPTFPRTVATEDGFERVTVTISELEWKRVTTPLELEDGQALTTCDKCRQTIRIDQGIAAEHNMVVMLRKHGIDARMEQTGGMCDAMSVGIIWDGQEDLEGAYYMMVYEPYDGENHYIISRYDKNGDWDEQWGEDFSTYNQVLEFFLEQDDVRRINVPSKE